MRNTGSTSRDRTEGEKQKDRDVRTPERSGGLVGDSVQAKADLQLKPNQANLKKHLALEV